MLGDRRRAADYIAAIRSCESELETLDDRLRACLSSALCSWLTRRRDLLRHHIESGAQLERILLSAGTTNLLALDGNIILGASHASWGDYDSALQYSLASFDMARKLGNDGKLAASCLNLAIVHGRLGSYAEQIRFADQSLRLFPNDRYDSRHASARYYLAMGHFMTGENRRAAEEAERMTMESPSGLAPWAAQCIPLMGADVLYAVGERERAIRVARDGLEISGRRPETDGYAGMVARWIAVTAAAGRESEDALEILHELTSDIASFDLMDQAEIVCGRLWLEKKVGGVWSEGRGLLAQILGALPKPVEDQLRRFGVLD
jgi:tetratricopeptide (TPR) repeat protein